MSTETPYNETFSLVFTLANRVMGWYGFTHDYDYSLLSLATPVAVELVKRGHTDAALAGADIEAADAATGGKMRLMFDACNPPRPATVSAGE